MKMNVKITQKGVGFLETDKELVNIDVCNGNWKYWDEYMETDEKISLTLNTINEAHYLHLPVKDAYGFHDEEAYARDGTIQIKEASVRTYDNLLSFINYRLCNVKEDVKRGLYERLYAEDGGRVFNAVLFDSALGNNKDVIKDIVYENDGMIEVKIAVI